METECIAAEIEVDHPSDPFSGENIVIATDFLINIVINGEERMIARTIKQISELHNERQIQKFEIERRYWEKRGIDWGIVTENEINKILASNISIIHPFR